MADVTNGDTEKARDLAGYIKFEERIRYIAQDRANVREAAYQAGYEAGKLDGDERAVELANGVMRQWAKGVLQKLEVPQVDSLRSAKESA